MSFAKSLAFALVLLVAPAILFAQQPVNQSDITNDEVDAKTWQRKQKFLFDNPFITVERKIVYPVWNNGQPTLMPDADIYRAKKEQWIAEHPEEYAEMNKPKGKHLIPQSEFETFPEHKKQHILSNPELYQITPQ